MTLMTPVPLKNSQVPEHFSQRPPHPALLRKKAALGGPFHNRQAIQRLIRSLGNVLSIDDKTIFTSTYNNFISIHNGTL